MRRIFAANIHQQKFPMEKYENLKDLVGHASNITITSELRYSELDALAVKTAAAEHGTLTIVLKPGTLNHAEVAALVRTGKGYVGFDFSRD